MTNPSRAYDERVSSSGQYASPLDTQPLLVIDMPPQAQEHALRTVLVEALGEATSEDPRVHRMAFSITAAISEGATVNDLEAELPETIGQVFPYMTNDDANRHLTRRITTAIAGRSQRPDQNP